MASSDCLVKQLLFGSVNVCGLKRRLDYPEFVNTICKYDILCFTETKLDSTDVVSVPGYNFLSQHRKQNYIRKSGGIGVLYKSELSSNVTILDTESDYIFWIRVQY